MNTSPSPSRADTWDAQAYLQRYCYAPLTEDFRWLAHQWDVCAYLQQNYAANSVSPTSAHIASYLANTLQRANRRFPRAIDFGCGPSLFQANLLAPYVDELALADFVPDNLFAIQRWLDDAPCAHNWDAHLKLALDMEARRDAHAGATESSLAGASANTSALAQRRALLRTRASLRLGDLHRPYPLNDDSQFDLVTSFFCAETAAVSHQQWRKLMMNLCELLAPGGTLIIAVMRNVHYYTVGQTQFPCACIDETELADFFTAAGFAPAQTEITVCKLPEWSPAGFGSFCLVNAEHATDL